MDIKIINNIYTDENTYIVYEGKNAVVIDPGNSDEEIIKECEKLGVSIGYILITHCHYDHIEFMEQLREKTGSPLVCSEKCAENIKNIKINLSVSGLGKELVANEAQIIVKDNEALNVGDMYIKCIYTPGHTNGGVCYLIGNSLFSGDTLFLRTCGRWDLPTGDEKTLVSSIKEKLYNLEEEITVYPGHGSKTSIGYEKKFNLVVKGN